MSKDKSTSVSFSFGTGGVLTLIFIVLKLVGVEPISHWSWIWVLSPMWISLALFFVMMFLFLVFAGIIAAFSRRF